jgi:NTE family protein
LCGPLVSGRRRAGRLSGGVYEALAEREIEPNWIAGISIGAINSAIVAGNPRGSRVGKLRQFWEGVSAHSASWAEWLPHLARDATVRGAINQIAAGHVLVGGVPGFFSPRMLPPASTPAAATARQAGTTPRR